MRAASSPVPIERLKLSRAPAAELAAAALRAMADVGLERPAKPGYLVVAVEPGRLADAQDVVDAALAAAD